MIGHITEKAVNDGRKVVNALSDKLNSTGRSCKVSYPNGDYYEGDTCGAQRTTRHGYGVYQYKSGKSRYEGEFVDGEKSGHGTLFFGDGDVYDGQWYDNRQHGRGVHVHWAPQVGVIVYEGEFREGLREGFGGFAKGEHGALLGLWAGGQLVRGVQARRAHGVGVEPGDVEAFVVGVIADEQGAPAKSGCAPQAEAPLPGRGPDAPRADPAAESRELLGRRPRDWRPAEVRLWLRALGLEETPERAAPPLAGGQLLAVADPEQLAAQRQPHEEASELAGASWRHTLAAAHSALRLAASSEGALESWEEFQSKLPSVKGRIIPLAEITAARIAGNAGHAQAGSWRKLAVEVFPLPLCLPFVRRPSSGSQRVALDVAQSWARDLEALAALHGHANVRSLLGVTLVPAEARPGSAVLALVHEVSWSTRLLFEWIHASLPDGSRRPLDFRSELRICIGLCDGLKALSSKGLCAGALCSVNVELVGGGQELVPKITRVGASWWRWGWRESLRTRKAGQPRRQALSVEDIVRKYAACPVNWLSPEVLRGDAPSEAADVYSFGLVLWEMLYRDIPFGDFSIAQIIGAVGYGRRQLQAQASPGASTETSLLHEVVNRCAQGDALRRPSCAKLLESLQEASQAYERRKAKRSVLGKLGDKAEGFLASNLLSSSLQRSLYGSDLVSSMTAAATAAGPEEEGPRMVRLASGEWVQVDDDLVELFPGDEEKWRALMDFRAMLPESAQDQLQK